MCCFDKVTRQRKNYFPQSELVHQFVRSLDFVCVSRMIAKNLAEDEGIEVEEETGFYGLDNCYRMIQTLPFAGATICSAMIVRIFQNLNVDFPESLLT